eukprot:COSAG05_NODE_911_length_6636_cov_56.263577_2_plen_287_part_00
MAASASWSIPAAVAKATATVDLLGAVCATVGAASICITATRCTTTCHGDSKTSQNAQRDQQLVAVNVLDVQYREAQPADAEAINLIYKEAGMVELSTGIKPGSREEEAFWSDWANKWRRRLEMSEQRFIVAVAVPQEAVHPEVVGVARGGIVRKEDGSGKLVSLLELRAKEAACAEACTTEDVVAYGLEGMGSEEQCLGPVCQTFDVELNGLFVRPAYQRQGLGGELTRRMMSMLTLQGHRTMTVWAYLDNADALRFYERLGGQRVGCRRRRAAIVRFAFDLPAIH